MRDLVGIRGLVNLIEIRPAIEPRDVTRQIKSAFRRRSFRGAGDVSVVVNGGTVTLYGHLESWSERDAARSIAWRARGVRNVVDQITIAA